MSVGLQVSPEWWVAGPYQWRLPLVRTSGGCRWSVPLEAAAGPYQWRLTLPALPQVMKTCRMMGIQTVAVHSDVDASAVSQTSNHQSTPSEETSVLLYSA